MMTNKLGAPTSFGLPKLPTPPLPPSHSESPTGCSAAAAACGPPTGNAAAAAASDDHQSSTTHVSATPHSHSESPTGTAPALARSGPPTGNAPALARSRPPTGTASAAACIGPPTGNASAAAASVDSKSPVTGDTAGGDDESPASAAQSSDKSLQRHKSRWRSETHYRLYSALIGRTGETLTTFTVWPWRPHDNRHSKPDQYPNFAKEYHQRAGYEPPTDEQRRKASALLNAQLANGVKAFDLVLPLHGDDTMYPAKRGPGASALGLTAWDVLDDAPEFAAPPGRHGQR